MSDALRAARRRDVIGLALAQAAAVEDFDHRGEWADYFLDRLAKQGLTVTEVAAATPPSPAPGLPLDVGLMAKALEREWPYEDDKEYFAGKAGHVIAQYVRLAADAATDEAERNWSQPLPRDVP